jgi:glycosyltransferase involved in cell wall biosynthesis
MKMFLYLAAGRAILGPAAPDTAELLAHDRNAWLTKPDDLDDAVSALNLLTSTPALVNRLGEQARDTAQTFTWEARGARLVNFVETRM